MTETKPKGITPSQTVGPFFAYGLTPGGRYEWNDAFTANLVTADATGERIRIKDGCSTATANPCPTACWRFGRPMH